MTEHRAPYPFVREVYSIFDFDEETGLVPRVESFDWRPGTEFDANQYGERRIAHAVGEIILTEVARFKPGRYPERVFFTRQWLTPEGNLFGKTRLRMTTASAFSRLIKGYGAPYTVQP